MGIITEGWHLPGPRGVFFFFVGGGGGERVRV